MKLIYIALVSILLFSCEDLEQAVDYELPYEEKLVIDGNLAAKASNISVIVTKTIPPLERVTFDKVRVADAECKVYYEDKVIDLELSENQGLSVYYSREPVEIKVGVEYRLEVKWNGKTAIARTTIPKLPEIVAVSKETITDEYDWSNEYYKLSFQNEEKGVLQISDDHFGPNESNVYIFKEESKIYDVWVQEYRIVNNRDSVFTLFYYDFEYLKYHNTRNEGDSDGGIFGSSGLNIEGNIEGDEAIGLWIGYNQKQDTISKYLR